MESIPSILKNRWSLDPLRNYEDGKDILNKNTKTLRKMVYVKINENIDKLIEKYKNLWLIHGLKVVLKLYKIFEKSQV